MLLLAKLLPAGSLSSRSPDYDVLSRRMRAHTEAEGTATCLFLDALVPRQRVELVLNPPVSVWVREAREAGDPLVVLGRCSRTGRLLRRGVEARIESMSAFRASDGFFSSHSTTPMCCLLYTSPSPRDS